MMKNLFLFSCLGLVSPCLFGQQTDANSITWQVDNLISVGGYPATISGSPVVVASDHFYEWRQAGRHTFSFDANGVASGHCFLKFAADHAFRAIEKITLIK